MTNPFDADTGDTYLHSSTRAQTNPTYELDRWLPLGVRNVIRSSTPGKDMSHLPSAILKYMAERGITTTPQTGSNRGITILSDLGKKLREANIKRLKGRKD